MILCMIGAIVSSAVAAQSMPGIYGGALLGACRRRRLLRPADLRSRAPGAHRRAAARGARRGDPADVPVRARHDRVDGPPGPAVGHRGCRAARRRHHRRGVPAPPAGRDLRRAAGDVVRRHAGLSVVRRRGDAGGRAGGGGADQPRADARAAARGRGAAGARPGADPRARHSPRLRGHAAGLVLGNRSPVAADLHLDAGRRRRSGVRRSS